MQLPLPRRVHSGGWLASARKQNSMSVTVLPFWKALAAFEFQSEEVLINREWRSKFPKAYEQLDALMDSPPPVWGQVCIP